METGGIKSTKTGPLKGVTSMLMTVVGRLKGWNLTMSTGHTTMVVTMTTKEGDLTWMRVCVVMKTGDQKRWDGSMVATRRQIHCGLLTEIILRETEVCLMAVVLSWNRVKNRYLTTSINHILIHLGGGAMDMMSLIIIIARPPEIGTFRPLLTWALPLHSVILIGCLLPTLFPPTVHPFLRPICPLRLYHILTSQQVLWPCLCHFMNITISRCIHTTFVFLHHNLLVRG